MAKRKFESDAGPTQRQLRVGEVIRRALSEALMRGETHEPELDGVSITVTAARHPPTRSSHAVSNAPNVRPGASTSA